MWVSEKKDSIKIKKLNLAGENNDLNMELVFNFLGQKNYKKKEKSR